MLPRAGTSSLLRSPVKTCDSHCHFPGDDVVQITRAEQATSGYSEMQLKSQDSQFP